MMLLAVVDDLLFRAKIEAAARSAAAGLTVVSQPDALREALGGSFDLAVVDLNLAFADTLAMVALVRRQKPALAIIGFCAHVQDALKHQALACGCSRVVPRSVFVQRLAGWLSGQLGV